MSKSLRFLLSALFILAAALTRAATPAPSAEEAKPLPVGAKAPGLTLTDLHGAQVGLAATFAAQPTVLVFYRGSWCPYCNAQLAALGELEPKLQTLGYQVIAISPDTAEGLQKMAGKNHLAYRLLSDHGMTASAAYGVAFRVSGKTAEAYQKHGITLTPIPDGEGTWLPVPTVYLIGRDGVIKFVYSNPNYKVRLATADLLKAAESAAK